nr:putative uncharacterized protein DDB_G0290521 [Drosophila bipectinata]
MESKVPPQAEDNVGQDQPNTIVIQLVTIPYNSNRQATPYSVQAIPLYFGPTDPQAGPAQRGVPDRTRIPGAPDMAAPPKQMRAQSPNRSPRNCCTQCRGQNYSQAPLPSFIPARTYPMAPGPRPGVRRYPTEDEARLPRRCFCQCSCQRNTVPQQEVLEEQPETLNNSHREQTPVAEPGDEGYRDQGTNTTEAGAAGTELPNLAALKVICESLGKAMVAAAAVAVEAAQKKTMGIDTDKSADKSNDQSNLSSPKLKASFHNRLIHDYIPSDPGDVESIDADAEQSPENEPEDMRAVDDEKLINVENQNNTDSIDENKNPNEVLKK